MIDSPCYGCTQRKVNCHAHCNKYAKYLEDNNKRKDTIAKNRKADVILNGYLQSKRSKLDIDSPFF